MNIARSDVSDVTCMHRVHVHVYCGEDGGEAQHGVWVCLCASCACMYTHMHMKHTDTHTSEPKITINSYLEPLVKELCSLWEEGLTLKIHSVPELQKVHYALLCVACDLPASRKVCGFLGHSANLGCPKCYKVFPGTFGKKIYSGF